MQFTDPNNPNEKKKLIVAGVLGLAAILLLGYVFFGGKSTPTVQNNRRAGTQSPTPARIVGDGPTGEEVTDDQSNYQPVIYTGTAAAMSEPNRNIFAYYEAPTPAPKVFVPPTPTPTPVPPLTLSALTPATVYARTADFNLQVTGDKFTPAVRVVIEGRELPTRF